MSRFVPKIGDLVVVTGRSEEDASLAFVGAVRERGFAYDVFLAHPIEDMAGPMDLVLDEGVSSAAFRLVVQMDSRVIVLADDITPSPWRLEADVLPFARVAYSGGIVNQDSIWTGMPIRGQLDQRLTFKHEQSLLGDRLNEPYADLAIVDLIFDPTMIANALQQESPATLEATIHRISTAPVRAFSPESVMALGALDIDAAVADPLLKEALSLALLEGMSTPQMFRESEEVGVIAYDRVVKVKRSELVRV
jgi:hypothetical protein